MKLAISIVMALVTNSAAEEKLTGNVLVWGDAPMYLDPDVKGAHVRIATLDQGREHDIGFVLPMQVVGTRGELVEVEPTADVQCAWWRIVRPEGISGVRLYVKRSDLAPVLTKPFSAKFKDGSRIDMQPGVAVLGGKVAFHEGILPAAVPEASIGVAYAPKAIKAVPKRGKRTFLLDEKTDVILGDQTFVLGPWVASKAEKRGKRMLVHLAARCMTAVVSAPKDHVHADVAFGRSATGPAAVNASVAASSTERYYLPSGTPLTSEKGDHVVGTLSADRDIKKPSGKRACTDFVLSRDEPIIDAPRTLDPSQPSRTLRLCAPVEAVKVEKLR